MFINLECAKASRVDFEDVTLRADYMPLMQCARPSVCGVAPLLMLSGTDIDMLNQVHELTVFVALGDAASTSSGTRLARQLLGFVFGKGSAAVYIMLWRLAYAFALDAS